MLRANPDILDNAVMSFWDRLDDLISIDDEALGELHR